MTADELKAARRRLGLSQAELAVFLRLEGGDRVVRRWEQGERPVSGPVSVAIAYALEHGTDVPPLPKL